MAGAEELRRLIPDAAPIFFHGRSLRPVQAAAVPLVVRGRSVLLSAPTASGKTEAAIAPLYQRHVSFGRKATSVVYVAPTKALVNDVVDRLTAYFASHGAASAVARYTGDHHEFGAPEGNFILAATPEALDSLQLMRPQLLAGVRCGVVDEIHFLHGHPRGQQLRHVVSRIRAAAAPPGDPRDTFQLVGMSATIEDMDGVRRVWLGEDSDLVDVGGAREIKVQLRAVDAEKEAAFLVDWLEQMSVGKALVFCNRRNTAHALALQLYQRLGTKRWSVYLHIGPLSPEERVRVETDFKAARHAVCVSTSTLEVGMDIGDVDAVALLEPPLSVGSLLQRAGRAGRRTDSSRLMALHRDLSELRAFQALLAMAEAGEFDEVYEYDRPSVRFQQIMSLAWRATRLDKPLTLRRLREMTGDAEHITVANDMISSGALRSVHGALVPSDEWMEVGDKRRLHAVIQGSLGRRVTSATTGAPIAKIPAGTAAGIVFLGGSPHAIEEAAGGGIVLAPLRGRAGSIADFSGGYGRSRRSRGLVRRLAIMNGRDPDRWSWHASGVETMGGYAYNAILATLLERYFGWKDAVATDTDVTAREASAPIPIGALGAAVEREDGIPNIAAVGMSLVQKTPYLKHLGAALRRQEAEAAVPLKAFMAWLDSCAASAKD